METTDYIFSLRYPAPSARNERDRNEQIVRDYMVAFSIVAELDGTLERDLIARRQKAGNKRKHGHGVDHKLHLLEMYQTKFSDEWRSNFGKDSTNFLKLIVAYYRTFAEPGPVELSSMPKVLTQLVACVLFRNWAAHGRSRPPTIWVDKIRSDFEKIFRRELDPTRKSAIQEKNCHFYRKTLSGVCARFGTRLLAHTNGQPVSLSIPLWRREKSCRGHSNPFFIRRPRIRNHPYGLQRFRTSRLNRQTPV